MTPPPCTQHGSDKTAGTLLLTIAATGLVALGVIAGWLLNDLTSGTATAPTASAMATPAAPVTVTDTPSPSESVPSKSLPSAATPTTPALAPTTHKLRGTLQLVVDRNPRYPDNCRGFDEEGYGDLYVGQQVVVSDSHGQVIATGQLDSCKFSPLESAAQARGIIFQFTVPDVPEADFYQVEVSHRGQVMFSAKDMQHDHWKVALNL